jgi:hypothetical protein
MRRATFPGTTLVLVPPSMRPTLSVGWPMPDVRERIFSSAAVEAYRSFSTPVAARSASMPVCGMPAWALRPWSVASSCRQPLCAVTMPYENPAQMAKSGA